MHVLNSREVCKRMLTFYTKIKEGKEGQKIKSKRCNYKHNQVDK